MADNNTELTLKYAGQIAVVSPFGASLRKYSLNGWNAVWGYSGGAAKRGGQGDVLIPFPGRVRDATYSVNGAKYELARTDKDGPNAIHGFLRAELFETVRSSETEVAFAFALEPRQGYPFRLSVEVVYALGDNGLKTSFRVTNKSEDTAPVGAGFHPYFCGDHGALEDWVVTIPAQKYLEMEKVLPTGRVLPVSGTEFDFRSGRVVGDSKYNGCVAELDRSSDGFAVATVRARDSRRFVSVRMDRSFDYVVIYTGDAIAAPDARKGFAIEPMTCGPDAFNHKDWGLRLLAPRESLSGSYWIKAHDA